MTEPVVQSSGGALKRLFQNDTTIDFYGRRKRAFVLSAVILLAGVVSLVTRGLDLGIDFRGGVSWEVPSDNLSRDDAVAVLESNGVATNNAKIQTLSTPSETRLRIQVGDQPEEVRLTVRAELAEAAGVAEADVSVDSVSAAWGRTITEKAVRALVVFFVIVSAFIAWRFDWKMAVAALLAVLHDVLISVGVYSLFSFQVTPATLVAFLTILGYSLYDTIVVFDKVKENTVRFTGSRVPFADVVNVSMNQVLMRSLSTTVSSLLPVLSLLLVGARIMGAVALQEFALALFVGLLAGAYSSLFIAAPFLALLREREPKYRSLRGTHVTGDAMRQLALHGPSGLRREHGRVHEMAVVGAVAEGSGREALGVDATTVLTHPPRPRKKRRR